MKYFLHSVNSMIWAIVINLFLNLVIPTDFYLKGYICGAFITMFYYVGFNLIKDEK